MKINFFTILLKKIWELLGLAVLSIFCAFLSFIIAKHVGSEVIDAKSIPTDLIAGVNLIDRIETGSTLEPNKAFYMLDNDANTFWHRNMPFGNSESVWVEVSVDLTKSSVGGIAVAARKEIPTQLFRTAFLSGSFDRKNWRRLAILRINETPRAGVYYLFKFNKKYTFPYYRLDHINEPFFSGMRTDDFYSISEFKLLP